VISPFEMPGSSRVVPPAPLLVGQRPPAGGSPRAPLFPSPPNCAGWRLWELTGLPYRLDYLRSFWRINVIEEPGAGFLKRDVSGERLDFLRGLLVDERVSGVVFCGSAVAEVCGYHATMYLPFSGYEKGRPFAGVVIPHPSGRNRRYNDQAQRDRAREVLTAVLRGSTCSPSA